MAIDYYGTEGMPQLTEEEKQKYASDAMPAFPEMTQAPDAQQSTRYSVDVGNAINAYDNDSLVASHPKTELTQGKLYEITSQYPPKSFTQTPQMPQVQSTQPQSPFAMATQQINQYGAAQKQLTDAEVAKAQKMGAATAVATKAHDDQMSALEQEHFDKMTKMQNDVDDKLSQVDSLAQDYSNNHTIDPKRYWTDKSAFQKVLAGIAMTVGGVASGMGHQPNYAYDVINKAIDQDIDAQKFNIDQKKGALDAQGHMLNQLMNVTNNREQAFDALRAIKKDSLVRYLDTLAAQNPNLNVQELKAKLQLSAMDDKNRFSQGAYQNAYQSYMYQNPALMQSAKSVTMNGQNYMAYDEPSAKEARQVIPLIQQGKELLGELKQLRKQTGGETGLPFVSNHAAIGDAYAKARTVQNIIKQLQNVTRATEDAKGDMKNIEKIMPTDTQKWFELDKTMLSKLDTVSDIFDKYEKTTLPQYLVGYKPLIKSGAGTPQ